ncbi:MAG: amidohydrolase [Candidatus Dormibacteraeota bacterium]|nr:amidohydrolase [Candidatus Dormibacteraeota bacterium]
MSIRYRADAVVTCDPAFSVHRPGVVDVEGGRITWVGPAADAPATSGPEHRLAGLLMPGLINVHCHSPMTLFRGVAEDVPLAVFLHKRLWPRESRLERDDVYWGMTLACAELLRAGVTTTCEMYMQEEAILAAVLDSGTRCLLTPAVLEMPSWPRFPSWRQRLADVLAFRAEHAASHERVEVGVAAHSAYALPLEGVTAVARAAQEVGALFHIHVAETRDEAQELERRHGNTVPALLADQGCFDGRVLAAHSVWLSDADLQLFAEHDVAVAHCPQSNAKLGAGIARLTDMLRLRLRVGLGTDGPASNNDLDLWEEMRLAPLLARLKPGEAQALPAPDAIRLATSGGAAALGRDDIGTLEPGRVADMVLVRLDDPAFVPLVEPQDVCSHLLWSASSRLISDVWVAGKQVVANGECLTVDRERAQREVQLRAVRLAG